MNIKDYWQLPTHTQNHLQRQAAPKPAYMRPKGCKCHMPDAHECYMQQRATLGRLKSQLPVNRACACQCHSDGGGEAYISCSENLF